MSFFAPQAYTKETLSKAFEWLQHQPASVKQAAANPDMLVSIYLQAQRQGIQKIDADAPVSSRKFIDDLKTLSRDFAQFEDSPSASSTATKVLTPPAPSPVIQQQRAPEAPVMQQQVQAPQQPQPMINTPPQINVPPLSPPAPQMRQQTTSDGFFSLDEKSLVVVRRLQERFNLSTPQEALRMIIAVGIEQISRWN